MTVAEKRTILRNAGVQVANNANESTCDRLASENGISFNVTTDTANNGNDTNANNGTDTNGNNGNGTNGNNGNDSLQKFITQCGGEFFDADGTTAQDAIANARAKEYPDFGRDIPSGKYQIINKVTVKTHKGSDGRTSNIWCCVIVALDGNNVGTHYLLQLAALRTPQYPYLQADGTSIEFNAPVPVRQGAPTSEKNAESLKEVAKERNIQLHHAFGRPDNPNATRIWNRILTWATIAE